VALAKVLSRGQVTLPQNVRQEAQIRPGDTVNVFVVGPGQLKVEVVHRMDPEEFFEAYRIDVPIDLAALRAEWEVDAADDVIRKLG
jgi:bifunctional DNA-binding transcriptional regulator/antitoxin component of YhaV-PrlF toxin-antitoxin module